MTLELRSVSYRYAGTTRLALDSIDLVIQPGEVVGLVGPNEAGKSTLALVASGLAPATIGGRLDGVVRIDDLATSGAAPHELARRCGVLFQAPATQLSGTTRTVWEEVAFAPRNLGLPLAEIVERVTGALETLGIAELGPRPPGRLSGGQSQLVALASVLAMRPRYLILDEPTSELDPGGSRLVADALARLAGEGGVGLLVIEHKTWLLEELAGRVVAIDAGRIVRDGATREVLSDPLLARIGVEAPPRVRLQASATEAGVRLPEAKPVSA
jgi:energy-coupling factor transporter ATP-binding protein EcfA2